MSDAENAARAARIARYKEERRRQLAAAHSSTSEGPRTTRTARLRAAATAATTTTSSSTAISSPTKKEISSQMTCPSEMPRVRQEKDKSAKRKSNLNRSLNCEEVPSDYSDDPRITRRRRREVTTSSAVNETKSPDSESSLTATNPLSSLSSSPITASLTTTSSSSNNSTPKKSQLSVHMENARRSVTKTPPIRRTISSPNNKENVMQPFDDTKPSTKKLNGDVNRSSRLSRRMEELHALTRDTLVRVERLRSKTRESPKREVELSKRFPKTMKTSSPKVVEEMPPRKKEVVEVQPISILKRKISQEENKSVVSTYTPPVTFSPNVVEPPVTNRRQGILKKRRSLDESQVLRHRSCSPDTSKSDSRSILKNQRRSSLEEITRVPGDGIQSILKRRTSRNEEDLDNSLNSPQSILKRRSGASSAGSSSNTQHHVSIATAVFLAAADGAEIVLETGDTVKPILKKKSFSEEGGSADTPTSEQLKPILKKKSSTDTDDSEEKPKRPILKLSRNSLDSAEFNKTASSIETGTECEVRPILKTSNRDEFPRPRLSFCATDDDDNGDLATVSRVARRPQPITDFQFQSPTMRSRDMDRDVLRPRVTSVSQLVMSFEKSTGAIPKRSSFKRTSDRFKTQPITFNEFEASLNYVQSQDTSGDQNHHSLLDLTTSLENESKLNSLLSNSVPNTSTDSGVGKMSSDSAFQSLGDGLELEQEASSKEEENVKGKMELQIRAIAEEAKNFKLVKVNAGVEKYKNRRSGAASERAGLARFSTQPVTLDEVHEAFKNRKDDEDTQKDEPDPSKLSLSERIKLFNKSTSDKPPLLSPVPKRRTRFITQPVTSDEVESALNLNQQALDSDSDRKGILKHQHHKDRSKSPPPQRGLGRNYSNAGSILKQSVEATYDEGISSDDSDTDSDFRGERKYGRSPNARNGSDQTSDESSGGREIQSIIGREAMLKRRQMRERTSNDIQKSRSQATVLRTDDDHYRHHQQVSPLQNRLPIGVQRSLTTDAMHRSIGELQDRLRQSGDNEWRKRIPKLNNATEELSLLNVKNLYNDELSEKKSILKEKKDELDASSKLWKNRVEKSDASNFSVTAQIKNVPSIPINIEYGEKAKKVPTAKRFKGKDCDNKDAKSTPTSPLKFATYPVLDRSISVPDNDAFVDTFAGRKVTVTKPDDDETYKNFFKSTVEKKTNEHVEVSVEAFDYVTQNAESLLVQRKNVSVQKRRMPSKNPLKSLRARPDIQTEYTEIITGVAMREQKRLNVEKLSKNSNLAVEALAGLASKENFAAVALKKSSTAPNISNPPFKSLMLLQVKGRRHVQIRLVEPVASSINQGDNYILITPSALYNYVGAYSNVIEQSRAADVIYHIQQSGDLGCKVEKAVVLKGGGESKQSSAFWKLLESDGMEVTDAGHPDEDEIYESAIINTNMIYSVEDSELAPVEKYWGAIPKIEMLQNTKVYVFDFGSEMYVWSGKNADADEKRTAMNLAKELWENGYNYTDCSVCPLNVASMIGAREKANESRKAESRPDWALFAKVTQHRETILFREKFLDWPDYTRIIKVRENSREKSPETKLEINPCDALRMSKCDTSEPNFEVENTSLGRGREYYDNETNRYFKISTLAVNCWVVFENSYEKLDQDAVGHFYDGDSYIVRWQFRVTVSGRELSGKPSKHTQVGRDRCVYFYWLGRNASINEKGAAAILTAELDSENARQIRVTQGSEPPAFLQLFNGLMFIHSGKRDEQKAEERLYLCHGEIKHESVLIEVPCSASSLRSKASFIYVTPDRLCTWNGCKSSKNAKNIAQQFVDHINTADLEEFGFGDDLETEDLSESCGDEEFLRDLDGGRESYNSLLQSELEIVKTPRMFRFDSISGTFEAEEVLCAYRSELLTAFPFLQNMLYTANQPALFLFDNGEELWLWQGWWPEREDDSEQLDQTGSGTVRWQAERRAAMQTAVEYWRIVHPDCEEVKGYLVWAGLEPLMFTSLFPYWYHKEDAAVQNIKEGKKASQMTRIEDELALLSRTTYPLSELLQRPLPEGVNPTNIETYLSTDDFTSLFTMSKAEFQKLPSWKQTKLKKEKGLY